MIYFHPIGTARHSLWQYGITLVELMIAMAITGMIGVTIASMLFAVSKGTASRTDMRNVIVQTKIINSRFGAAVRGAKMILDNDTDFLVLWTADKDGDGLPGLLELQRIEYDPQAEQLVSYEVEDLPVDDRDASITYIGTWFAPDTQARINSTIHETDRSDTEVHFTFTGTAVQLIGETHMWGGEAEVYIDGMFEDTVSFYTPESQQLQEVLFVRDNLPPGQHTFKMLHSKEPWIYVDAFRVYNNNTTYPLDEDFGTLTEQLKSTHFTDVLWVEGIVECMISLDALAPQSARKVSYQLTLRAGDLTENIYNTVCMRNRS